MGSRLNVLIPDGNSTWTLSVLNCLCQNSDYQIFVLSNKKRTPAKYSKHTSYYKYYKRTTDKNWLEVLSREIESNKISVIIPIAENEIRFFIINAHLLPDFVKVIPLPQLNNFETAIDKHKLSKFLDVNNLPHPRFNYLDRLSLNSKKELDLQFPILIKPLHEKGGDGILKFNSQSKLDNYLKKHSDLNEVFVQEYIDGYDIDCSVLCLNGKILVYTIQRGNLLGHNMFAPQLGFKFVKNQNVLNVVKQLMLKLNWSGIAHIDLRYDKKANDFKVIEVNARFWGSIEGSKFAGINFPHLAIQLALNNTIEPVQFKEIEYMRLKGVLKTIKRKPSFLFKKNFLLNNSETRSFLKDPIPTCYRFIEWLSRQLNVILLILGQELTFCGI